MDERTLYAKLLGLNSPWGVDKVELRLEEGEVHVWVALPPKQLWVCPDCLERAPIHDHRERVWRHLDTFQYRTLLHARVPRLNCPRHGIRQLRVPWAEEGSRFTALFEALAIDWMKQAPLAAVAERLHLSWDEAAGIQKRAVRRGLARRELETIRYLGVDETSFQRRHEYVSVVTDLERTRVLHVADDRKQESLDSFWQGLSREHLDSIEAVAMDMWEPYIRSTRAHLPDADSKIVFDKFHVAQHLNKAVDKVRRQENRQLLAEGKPWLVKTKFSWLRNPENFTQQSWREFAPLRESVLKTARAWALKEAAMCLWDLRYLGVVERNFRAWYNWAIRSRLEPIKRVARMIKVHWANTKTYFKHRITNAGAESINAKIQMVKYMSRGFRNRQRFRNAIYFHCGGLDLYPPGVQLGQ
ncbi:MAG: ISL3 family transposase [Woeseiaceae bacterium]|nr:ISL3 family transposase [Woeseiaceae bacterium]